MVPCTDTDAQVQTNLPNDTWCTSGKLNVPAALCRRGVRHCAGPCAGPLWTATHFRPRPALGRDQLWAAFGRDPLRAATLSLPKVQSATMAQRCAPLWQSPHITADPRPTNSRPERAMDNHCPPGPSSFPAPRLYVPPTFDETLALYQFGSHLGEDAGTLPATPKRLQALCPKTLRDKDGKDRRKALCLSPP